MDRNDLTQGTVWKKILGFFFPVLFGMLFQQLYNTADAVIVGRYLGANALAAVGGSASLIVNLAVGFFSGLGTGATVVVSHAFGAKEEERLSRTVHTAVLFFFLVGVTLTAVFVPLASALLRLSKNPAETMADATTYLRIYFVGSAPLLLFNIGSGILRAQGDARRPLIFLICCCLSNIVLDVLFVAILGWGVSGAAWATVIAQLISAVLVLLGMTRTQPATRLRFKALRIDPHLLGQVLRIGLPTGFQSSMYSISNLILQTAVNVLGTTAVAAWAAISRFDGIYWVISSAFAATVTAFVGQNYGARNAERLKKGSRTCLLMHLGTTAVVAGLMLLLVRPCIRLITDDAQVIELVGSMIPYFAPFYVIWSFIEVLAGTLNGTGDTFPPMLITLLGVCVLRILWVIFIIPLQNTMPCICQCYPVSWIVTATAITIYYKATEKRRMLRINTH